MYLSCTIHFYFDAIDITLSDHYVEAIAVGVVAITTLNSGG